VKYWMHCAHLQVEGRKMAKSLGNFYTLRDLLDRGYSGREVRYVLLSGHYRQTLNFTFAALDSARAALARLDEFGLRLRELAGDASPGEAPEWVTTGDADFRAAMLDDLNTPEALGAVFEMAHAGNRAMDAGRVTAAEAASACAVLQAVDTVLGVLAAAGDAVPEEIARLVTQRQEAREARDWAESDRIRDLLAGQGWEVRDTPEGAKLRRAH